jgi:hypothetical protein
LLRLLQAGAKVTIKTQDASGAPLKNELVVVEELNKPGAEEVFRALSEKNEIVPLLELELGVLRVTLTATEYLPVPSAGCVPCPLIRMIEM